MQVGCSIAGIVDKKYPAQGVLNICDGGFEHIFFDMSVCCGSGDLEKLGKPRRPNQRAVFSGSPQEFRQSLQSVLEQIKKRNLDVQAARAPYLPRDTKRGDLKGLLAELVQESILFCGQANFPFLVIQPQFFGVDRSKEWPVNREYYLGLVELARENRVQILLENQCRNVNGHLVRGMCSDGATAAGWVDRLNQEAQEERFGFCMDVGVCNLCGQTMDEPIQQLGKRLKAVILRDCDGSRECSMVPFTSVYQRGSQTNWLGLVRGLRDIGFDGELILDCEDTAAAFSPLLRPKLLKFTKSVADYFQWQLAMEEQLKKYRSIVLFGAGNMCRNYLRCFGDKYPPLFTCANNPASWGTSFHGVEVKPPESLKDLSADCGVFICNMYYWEVKEQLEAMGVKNIEFFNDEYLSQLVE